MRVLLTASSLAAAAVAASVVLTPAAADAAATTPDAGPSLAAIQARAVSAIDIRLVQLAKDDLAVAKAKHLTGADRSSLENVITSDDAGLAGLRATILAAPTRKQAASEYKTIYTGYRVFLLLQPQIRDVIAADALTAAADKISADAAALETRLSTPGPITAAESADIAAAKSDAAGAATAVNAEVAAVVALVPGEVTKTVRPSELAAAKADNLAARTQLSAAVQALRAARAEAAAPAAAAPATTAPTA